MGIGLRIKRRGWARWKIEKSLHITLFRWGIWYSIIL